jgi:hypothetical protein
MSVFPTAHGRFTPACARAFLYVASVMLPPPLAFRTRAFCDSKLLRGFRQVFPSPWKQNQPLAFQEFAEEARYGGEPYPSFSAQSG